MCVSCYCHIHWQIKTNTNFKMFPNVNLQIANTLHFVDIIKVLSKPRDQNCAESIINTIKT